MKKLILSVVILTFSFIARSQSFAIINDKDGFVNVRSGANLKSSIVGKIYNDEIFGIEDEDITKLEWLKVYKQGTDDKPNIEGYIHKSRVFFLSGFKSLKKLKIYADSCIVTNDSLSVTIKSAPFIASHHKLSKSGGDKAYNIPAELNIIDGKHFWGTDGEVPKKVITYVKVKIKGSFVNIPKSAFDDLYEPRLKSLTVYLGNNDTIYIEMDNSDGAGAYSVIWIIKGHQYLKRYIDNSNV